MLVLFMMSLATKFWQAFLAQGIGMGIAMGLTYVPAICECHRRGLCSSR